MWGVSSPSSRWTCGSPPASWTMLPRSARSTSRRSWPTRTGLCSTGGCPRRAPTPAADRSSSVDRDAAKLGEDVGIVCLVPVSEAPAHQLCGRRPRGALEDEGLAIDEVGRITGVPRDACLESREAGEWCHCPFPPVAHELVYPPRARSLWVRSHRRRRPGSKVEVPVSLAGSRRAPGKGPLGSGGIAECGAVELRLGQQSLALPARISPRLGKAHKDRPICHAGERKKIEEPTVQPLPVLLRPHGRGLELLRATPVPVVSAPELGMVVSAVLHEGEILPVRYRRLIHPEARDGNLDRREFIVPAETQVGKPGSKRRRAREHLHGGRRPSPAERDGRKP